MTENLHQYNRKFTSTRQKVYVNTTETHINVMTNIDLRQHLAVGDFCDIGIPYVWFPDPIVRSDLHHARMHTKGMVGRVPHSR